MCINEKPCSIFFLTQVPPAAEETGSRNNHVTQIQEVPAVRFLASLELACRDRPMRALVKGM